MAFPAFALVLGLSMLAGAAAPPSVTASLTQAAETEEGTVVQVRDGLDALLYSGRGFRDGELVEGSALLRLTGLQQLQVGSATVASASGKVHLTYTNGKVTVAAITAPALVTVGEYRVLVPVGKQWQSSTVQSTSLSNVAEWFAARRVSALPQRFLERQLQNVSVLPQRTPDTASLDEPGSVWLPKWMDVLLLSKAEQELQAQRRAEQYTEVRAAVTQQNASALEQLLSQIAVDDNTLSRWLAATPDDSAVSMTLLQELLQNEQWWLLYAVHPRWRDAAWTVPHKDAARTTRALRLLALPQSDTAPQAVSSVALQRWRQSVVQFSQSVAKPVDFLSALIDVVGSHVRRANRDGYPQRARAWAEELATLTRGLPVNLPDDVTEDIRHLQTVGSVDTSLPITVHTAPEDETQTGTGAEEQPAPASPPANADEEAFSPETVENRTINILQELGAIFTVETTVSATAPNTAEVRGIVFSTPKGDYVLDFAYNVKTNRIHDVVRGSKQYPYDITLQAFRNWLQN